MSRTVKRLLRYAKPWRGTLFLTVAVLIVGAVMNLFTPAIVRLVTAELQHPSEDSGRMILIFALVLTATYILRAVMRFLAMWQAHVAAWSYVPALTLRVYDHIQTLTPQWYSENQVGDIMSRVLTDTRTLEVLIAHTLPDLISNFVIIIGVAVMSANEKPFHSMASRKVPEAGEALKLIRNAGRVSSFCNDVIGDICGVISGSASATIAVRVLALHPGAQEMVITLAMSALAAGLTVGGKACGKSFALGSSTTVVRTAAGILHFFHTIPEKFTPRRKA